MADTNSVGDPAGPLGGTTPASNPQADPDSTPGNATTDTPVGGQADPGQDQRQTEGAGDGEAGDGEQPSDGKRKPERLGGWQRDKIRAEARAEFLQQELDRLRAERSGEQSPQPADPDAPPDPRDTTKYPLGDHDPLFIKDSAVHQFRQEQVQERRKVAEQAQAQAMVRRVQAFEEAALKQADMVDGIMDSVQAAKTDPTFPFSEAMAYAVLDIEGDKGPRVVHFLHHNRTEAARLARLSPIQAALEIGRIAERLPATPARRQTAAPPPPREVGGGASKVATFDPAKFKGGDDAAEHEAYRAWRAKQ